jgi:hypothetical protein
MNVIRLSPATGVAHENVPLDPLEVADMLDGERGLGVVASVAEVEEELGQNDSELIATYGTQWAAHWRRLAFQMGQLHDYWDQAVPSGQVEASAFFVSKSYSALRDMEGTAGQQDEQLKIAA